MVHTVSEGCWFRVQTSTFEILTPNCIFGQICAQKVKVVRLSENWYTWYLKDVDSYTNISFMNFQLYISFWANLGQKSQSCSFCLDVGIHGILRMLILIWRFVFFNFELKLYFLPNLGQKSQFCPFCLKIGTLGILRMQVLITRLVFWTLEPKFI